MTDAIRHHASRPAQPTGRGTQPLTSSEVNAPTPAPLVGSQEEAALLIGDQAPDLKGASRLETFAQALIETQPSLEEWIASLRTQAEDLLASLPIPDRWQAKALMGPLFKEGGETLAGFRDRLKQMLNKLLEFISDKKDAQRQIEYQRNIEWEIFFESLERYIENLQTLQKVESFVLEQRLEEERSVSRKVDRELTSATALPPEQRMTLLSAQLSKKD